MKRAILVASAIFALASVPLRAEVQQIPPTGGSTTLGSTLPSNLVCSGPINHDLPQLFEGTHIKWETGEFSDGVLIPDANFNPYATGGKLAFFWSNASNGNAGVAATATGNDWLVLQVGEQVGPSSVFSNATGAPTNWLPGVNGHIGFKFNCSTASICYGYAHMISMGPNGYPATLVSYCFDKAGDAITIAPSWIFRSGFEYGENIVTGTLYHSIDPSFDGTYVKWETAETSDGTATLTDGNFNAFRTGNKLSFFWPGSSSGNAGVAVTAAGNDWRVLQSGDQVGPSSTFSSAAGVATNWTPGVDGYLGFRFSCSTARTGICYGYVDIRTYGPRGFPAVLMKYSYNSAGDTIRIP